MSVRDAEDLTHRTSNDPPRQLSIARIVVALILVAGVVLGAIAVVRRVTRSTAVLASQWFAPYVDTTLTPLYPFEDAAAVPTPQIVLGFVVASPDGSCTPSWGSAYGLDDAAAGLDLDRRLTRLREHGGEPIVSFGGAANTELASACTDTAALQSAYRAVVDRYQLKMIDLDVEGDALGDTAATTRRAAALAALQRDLATTGRTLAVWLTLPVDRAGLAPNAQSVVTTMLHNGVALAGVNAMTMNFGDVAGRLRTNIERALVSTAGQLDAAYRASGVTLNRAQLWRRVGATPMIGVNDTGSEQLDLDTATWLVGFARQRGLGRLSMWSLNRDTNCGANIDRSRPSPHCSGIEQRPRAFADAFAAIGRATTATAALSTKTDGTATTVPTPTPAGRAPLVDDPATSPYPIWNSDRAYQQGRKVVWHRNVYIALWYTHGEVPDGANATDSPVPWRLVGPVLPGEHSPTTTTIPPNTYQPWDPQVAYVKGTRVEVDGIGYEAKWWTRGDAPGVEVANQWDTPWQAFGADPGSPAAAADAATTASSPPSTLASTPAAAPASTPTITTASGSSSTAASTTASSVTATAAGDVLCPTIPLGPTVFDDGSWELSPAGRQQLDAAAAQLAAARYARLTIIGRADRRPVASIGNDRLSQLRAQAVAHYLETKGVTVPIDIDARGDRDPVDGGTLAANRTVDIHPSCS